MRGRENNEETALSSGSFHLGAAAAAPAQGTRAAVFAGAFYDADPARLAALIDDYLRAAGPRRPRPGTRGS